MNSWFNQNIWNQELLQLSESEPAISHAVIAVSALHEHTEVIGIPKLGQNVVNGHLQFALEQYGRAITALKSRTGSNDPELKNIILVCCFLFVVFELFLGDCGTAYAHLQQGVMILRTQIPTESELLLSRYAVSSITETPLVTAIWNLDLQAIHFGLSKLQCGPNIKDIIEQQDYLLSKKKDFRALPEATKVRNNLLQLVCHFCKFCGMLTPEEIAADWAILSTWQSKLRIRLEEFRYALERLKTHLYRGTVRKKIPCGIDLLLMHQATLTALNDFCFVKGRGKGSDQYSGRFDEIIDLAERVKDRLLEDDSYDRHRRPSLFMETGVIQPLYYVCQACGDPAVVQRAMMALRFWPHSEGLWASNPTVRMTTQLLVAVGGCVGRSLNSLPC